uniref:Kinesin motor domain-containing protein n=1 Tax=Poecilia reticulata TaxID=8081 RepID=A0A3P9MUY3_POERE
MPPVGICLLWPAVLSVCNCFILFCFVLQHSCVEDKEHLQVYLRIRPFTSSERGNGESQVYGPETTQSELFEGTVKDLVKDVLEGENSLVFTYGVTNSGKTFTFLGPDSEAEAGILPRALRLIFSSIGDDVFQGLSVKPHRCREFLALSRQQQADEAQFKNSSTAPRPSTAAQDRIILDVKPNTKFSVWVSFCEIYNENIHDLLEVAPSGVPRRPALRLAQDANSNAYVKGRDLRWVQVSSAEEAFRVVKLGRRNQSFSSTRLNQLSSRSHSIFSIRILSVEDGDPPRVQTISEEREILEERAERRLEIFKNLTRNMSSAGCSSDPVTMVTPSDHGTRTGWACGQIADVFHAFFLSGQTSELSGL